EGQGNAYPLDAGHLTHALFDLCHHLAGNWTADGCKRHGDIDGRALDVELIDQAKVDDVHRDFRIVALTQRLVDLGDVNIRLADDLGRAHFLAHASSLPYSTRQEPVSPCDPPHYTPSQAALTACARVQAGSLRAAPTAARGR